MKINYNTIYNMDCLEGMDFIPDKSIDLILCDLPYGTTECEWDNIIPFDQLWEQYKRIIKENGAIVLTASQPFTTKLIASNLKWFRYEWIWKKGTHVTGFPNAWRMPLKNHENILVFYRKLPTYHPQGLMEIKPKTVKKEPKMQVLGGRNYTLVKPHVVRYKNFPKSVIDFPRDKDTFHPTQKPVALFEYIIKTYTNRKWVGFELVEEYCEKGKERINKNREKLGLPNVTIVKSKFVE